MTALHFKGRVFVENFHLGVPYHELTPVRSKGLSKRASLHDNLIVEGDNLAALKALLPTYHGKVKCIYIDPPYNTGNERWRYNDRVNSPLMKDWLCKVVDREDLTRHDKWCCMMLPRLKLLRELLRDDGAIFVSIDDNEVHRLRCLMDEVFGEENFLAQLAVQTNPRGRSLRQDIAQTHEYVLMYAQDAEAATVNRVGKTPESIAEYKQEDEHGRYRLLRLRNTGIQSFNRKTRPNLYFAIWVDPSSGSVATKKAAKYSVKVLPVTDDGTEGCWTWGKPKVDRESHLVVGRQARGQWRIYRKDYLAGNSLLTRAKSILLDKDVNHEIGKEVLGTIFGQAPFEYPKSPGLITRMIDLICGNDGIVLDSFAGSGTTAHAVLALNKADGGNRRFILVECEDYVDGITAERVRRVAKGVPKAKDEALREGLGGTFSYFKLGNALRKESMLEPGKLPSYERLAAYIFFTATGEEFDAGKMRPERWFIGRSRQYDVYLVYTDDFEQLKNLALTLPMARTLSRAKRDRLVFAPTKYVDQEFLHQHRITFQQLPFEIYETVERLSA